MNLGILNLSQNSFAKEIPTKLFNLVNLTCVNLQGNKVSGEIPHTIISSHFLEHIWTRFSLRENHGLSTRQ
jgi:hypothetical protein